MKRWQRVMAAVVLVAVAALVGHQQFVASWSNHCDPGNARFHDLKSDPVVGFHPGGELFTWENDGPDNLLTCTNASVTLGHVGQDVKGMFAATRADMTDSGWTAADMGNPPPRDFAIYEKTAPDGVQLTAVVWQQTAWVEVDLTAPGLHPGESGF